MIRLGTLGLGSVLLAGASFGSETGRVASDSGLIENINSANVLTIKVNDQSVLDDLADMDPTSVDAISGDRFRLRIANVEFTHSALIDPPGRMPSDKVAEALLESFALGEEALFSCWPLRYYTLFTCSVTVKERDLGEFLITAGVTPYFKEWGDHPTLHDAYREAEMDPVRGAEDAESIEDQESIKEIF